MFYQKLRHTKEQNNEADQVVIQRNQQKLRTKKNHTQISINFTY